MKTANLDIVYCLKNSLNNEELRYSLRSLVCVHAITGSRDIAFPNLDPQMKAMAARPDVFGEKVRYDVMEGGSHDYATIFRYLYNALPGIVAR